jgi:PAS domain S-box-containing protein
MSMLFNAIDYASIFKHTAIAMLVIAADEGFTMIDVNDAYLTATNTKKEDIIGKSVFSVFPANPTDEVSKNIERTIYSFKQAITTKLPHTMSNYRYDIPIRGTNQFEERYWTTTNTPVLGENGQVLYFIHSPANVTEQRKAREEQEKLLTIVANSVDLMSILDMNGINSYINEAGRKLLGFETDAEVLKTPISQLHLPEDFDLVEKEVLPTTINKGQWAGMMRVRHLQTGEIIPVFNNCIRINDPVTGEIIAIGAVMRDQRPELAAKQALAESEQLLRSVTSASPTGLWMSDQNGKQTYVNQTWVDWVGLSLESLLQDGWIKAIHDDDQEHVLKAFQEATLTHCFYETEFRIIHVDGTIHWCVATGKPQYLNNGEFSGYVGAYVDITEQKHLQQQKDDFIGIASHELKTPVTSIKAYAQVLERMLLKKGDEKEASMINKMDAQINRLTNLIGDLLDVTKINSGKLQFNDRAFDFNTLISEVVEELQRTAEQHLLIEELQATGIVFADRERIGQVITNLITNAIKYSPDSKRVIINTVLTDKEVVLKRSRFWHWYSER